MTKRSMLGLCGAAGLVVVALVSACGGSKESELFGAGGVSGGPAGTSGTSGTPGTSGGPGSSGDASSNGGVDAAAGCRPAVPGDCRDDELCRVEGCAESGGTCVKKPAGEPPRLASPVCGCDGVSYWNEAVATAFGASIRHAGACTADEARKCDDDVKCPDDLYCSHFVGENSVACQLVEDVQPRPVCWGLAPKCPETMPGRQAALCANGAGAGCRTICEAIRTEKPWYFATTTVPCF